MFTQYQQFTTVTSPVRHRVQHEQHSHVNHGHVSQHGHGRHGQHRQDRTGVI